MKQKTPIIDKNGKPTHVHKNVDVPSTSRTVGVSAPKTIAGSWDDFIPATPGAVSMVKDPGNGYAFYCYNDAAPEEFGLDNAYMDDFIEFDSQKITTLPKAIDEAIYGVNIALEDVTHTNETKYMQRVFLAHLEAIKEQVSTKDGVDALKRRARAYDRLYVDYENVRDEFEQIWDVSQSEVEKIYSYGKHLEAIGTSAEDFNRTLFETLKLNEPKVMNYDEYTDDVGKLYGVIKKAFNRFGF